MLFFYILKVIYNLDFIVIFYLIVLMLIVILDNMIMVIKIIECLLYFMMRIILTLRKVITAFRLLVCHGGLLEVLWTLWNSSGLSSTWNYQNLATRDLHQCSLVCSLPFELMFSLLLELCRTIIHDLLWVCRLNLNAQILFLLTSHENISCEDHLLCHYTI